MNASRNIVNSRVLMPLLCLAGMGLTGCGQLPISDAGSDGSAEPGQTVQLNGSGSFSPDRSSLSYSWSGTGSASSVPIAGGASAVASFTAPTEEGDLNFSLVVTNPHGSDEDTVTISVKAPAVPPNEPPTAVAGGDRAAQGLQAVTLDGSTSSDPEGRPLTYRWTQIGGTPQVTLSNPSGITTAFTAPDEDTTLEFQLEVTDDQGLTDVDSLLVAVAATPNGAPTADAGSDQTVDPGDFVQLNGTNSRDPENDPLTHDWTQISGTPVTLDDSTAATPGFAAPGAPDTLVFELTVSDDDGQTGQARVRIIVERTVQPQLYIANDFGDNVTSYVNPITVNGNVAPNTNLAGFQTKLFAPSDVVVNGGGQLIASNRFTPSITVYSDAALTNGNIAPGGNVEGLATDLFEPTSMTMNTPDDLLFVANVGTDSILVYDGTTRSTFNGNSAPIRTISSAGMEMMDPLGINFGGTDDLYVANNAVANVLVYGQASSTNGFVASDRKIESPIFSDNVDVFVDSRDTLYVVDAAGFIHMFDNAASLNGTLDPDATLEIPGSTSLSSIVIDSDGNAYIADYGRDAIYSYDNIRSRNGAFAPDRLIAGPDTQLLSPSGLFLVE